MSATPRPTPDGLDDLTTALTSELDDLLVDADALLTARYPGDPTTRQPVHTVYVPIDKFSADTPRTWGDQALALMEQYLPDATTARTVTGLDIDDTIYAKTVEKLRTEPVEDLRIDLEDGYGRRPDSEEDTHLAAALGAVATMRAGTTPPWFGIRFKSFEAPTRARGVRTLTTFVGALAAQPGGLPSGLNLTLPKVTSVDQVRAMVRACERLESALALEPGTLRFEIQVETAQAIMGPSGEAPVSAMIGAAQGRCSGLHYGTFDYSAGLGITAAYQSLEHPVADHAKAVMHVAAAQTGVRLSDGSTNVVAFGSREEAHATWALHSRLVTRSLSRGYYQGWDMHPGHLVTRYLATFAFFRAALPDAAARLQAYLGKVEGGVMDEPATARMLATALLRGLRCGAIDADEVRELSGLGVEQIVQLTR